MLAMFTHDNAVRADGYIIVLTEILDRSVVMLTACARHNVATVGKKQISFKQGMHACTLSTRMSLSYTLSKHISEWQSDSARGAYVNSA